eukprot:scaffold20.g7652.t1
MLLHTGEAPRPSTKETSKFLELVVQALLLLPSCEGQLADILSAIEGTPRLSEQLTDEDTQPQEGYKTTPRWHDDVQHKLQQAYFLRRKEGNPTNPSPLVETCVTVPSSP